MKQITYVYAGGRPTDISNGIISHVDYCVLCVGHYGLARIDDILCELARWRGVEQSRRRMLDHPFDSHYGNTSVSYHDTRRAGVFAQSSRARRPTYFYRPARGYVALNYSGALLYAQLVYKLVSRAAN